MFPRAEGDLRSFWQDTPIPSFNHKQVSWSLKQFLGIASGLRNIHVHQDSVKATQPSKPITEYREVIQGVERYGRHGDIKLENILWFHSSNHEPEGRGILKIADFGLGRFHGQDTRSRVNPDYIRGSPTYEPPECKLHQSVSRAYDMWSLGCLYLEFVTWLLKRWDAVEKFADARCSSNSEIVTPGGSFYAIWPSEVPHGPDAVVRDSVLHWIEDLHGTPRCSAALHNLLDLIQDALPVVNPALRISAEKLTELLKDILGRGEADASYLITPVPRLKPQNICPRKRALSYDPSQSRFDEVAKNMRLWRPP